MSRYHLPLAAICFALVLGLTTGLVSAQGPRPPLASAAATGASFTYQGYLQQDGRPVDGPVDLRFTLYDAADGETPFRDPIEKLNVAVEQGLFTVELDFGPVFDGSALWLAIAVRHPAGDGEFTALAPRQALTAAPYALYAQAAPWSGLGDVPEGFADSTDDDTLATLSAAPGQVLQWDGDAWSGVTVTSTEYAAGPGLILTDTLFSPDWGGSGSATTVARSDHDHEGVYALASHEQVGEDITSGTIADARIAASIARDTEVISLVLAQDGDGSGLDADLLDGQHAAAFAAASHTHPGGDITSAVSRAITATYAMTASEVPWSGIAGTPIDFADATDDDTLAGLSASEGQVPQWDGGAWVPATLSGGTSDDHFGAQWTGSITPTAGLEVANSAGHGIRGESNSASGAGVYAINDSSGLGLYVRSVSGLYLMEMYGSDPNDIKIKFKNNGYAYSDGNWATGGADMAEMLTAQEGLEPGDVLAIGPDGTLVRSARPYDTSVAGVHSTQPGFTGGASEDEDETGKVPLAVVGVAPVKASAENGAIRPGDLLVASSTPGHAMRAGTNPPQGSVIGKALEGLAQGTGVIRMLVTLQ